MDASIAMFARSLHTHRSTKCLLFLAVRLGARMLGQVVGVLAGLPRGLRSCPGLLAPLVVLRGQLRVL